MSENKRASTRYDRRLEIEYDLGPGWVSSFTKNMSLGGVSIDSGDKVAMGARLKVRFHIPTQKEAIEVGGTVRWMDSSSFGVQFDGLRAREVWALGKYFEQPA